jgi:hypothetical protein
MALSEASVQSFVLRIWQEEEVGDGRQVIWRGHITDIATGERRYVENIESIVAFLIPRFELLGVRVGLRWRVRTWMKRRRQATPRPIDLDGRSRQ